MLLSFSENVNIINTPRLAIDMGGSTVYATYDSGDGSSALTFKYIIQPNDEDLNGIDLSLLIDQNVDGDFQDGGVNSADLNIPFVATAGILVDAVVPTIQSITVPSDGNYVESNTLDFVVTYNKSVDVTNDPTLQFDLGGVTKDAAYIVSGTCSNNATIVTVTVGGTVSDTPTCTANAFTTATMDVSGIADNASVSVQADHDTASDSTNVLKDTVAPTITITSPTIINSSSASSHAIAGTCDEDGPVVIYI